MLNLLFWLAFVSLFLGQFAVIGRGEGFAFYLSDFFVLLFAVFGSFRILREKKFNFPISSVIFGLFCFWAFITLIPGLTTFSQKEMLIGFSYLLRFFVYIVSAIVIFTFDSPIKFFKKLFIFSFLLTLAGFVQLLVLPDFTVLDSSLGWDPHKNRLASTFFDPNFVGGILALSLGVFLGLSLYKKASFKFSEYAYFFGIPFLGLILTFSRSSWGMFAVIVFLLGLFKSKKMLLVGLLLAFLTYFAVPRVQTRLAGITDPSDSAAFRLISWKNTLEIAKDNLAFGTGFNTYRFVQKDYGFFVAGSLGGNSGAGSDSSILLVLATTGIFGAILFLSAFGSGVLGSFKEAPYLAFPLIGLFLHSQFVNSLFYPQIMFFYLPIILYCRK